MGRVIIAIVSVVVILSTMWWIGVAGESEGTVSGGEAKELVENGAVLVDVRTPREFANASSTMPTTSGPRASPTTPPTPSEASRSTAPASTGSMRST